MIELTLYGSIDRIRSAPIRYYLVDNDSEDYAINVSILFKEMFYTGQNEPPISIDSWNMLFQSLV